MSGRAANCQGGTDSPESARFKTIIPVDQLQVRAVASDAHECHGIWEMMQTAVDPHAPPDKIFQFARCVFKSNQIKSNLFATRINIM